MLTSQVKRFVSVVATRKASVSSEALKLWAPVVGHSLPTVNVTFSVSRSWPTSAFLQAEKRFQSTSCKEINVTSIVNDLEGKIESTISIPSSNSVKKENIEVLKYVAFKMNSGRWSMEEKTRFKAKLMELSARMPINNDEFFKELSGAVASRTVQQCKQHYNYYYK